MFNVPFCLESDAVCHLGILRAQIRDNVVQAFTRKLREGIARQLALTNPLWQLFFVWILVKVLENILH